MKFVKVKEGVYVNLANVTDIRIEGRENNYVVVFYNKEDIITKSEEFTSFEEAEAFVRRVINE